MKTKHYSLVVPIVCVAQLLFTAGWLVAALLQGDEYSVARHDISDLGAMTALAPRVWMIPMGLAGVVTMWFALGVLRPVFLMSGIRRPIGAWLVAFSLMGLDNVSDIFFRLECRAADPGCTPEIAAASVQGSIHMLVGLVCALITLTAPFVLAHHMRRLDLWKDLSTKTLLFGICFLIALIVYVITEGSYGHGYIQRIMCLMLSFGMIVLARRASRVVHS